MADIYASFPIRGVPVYTNLAAFPASTYTGALGVAADTGNLYEFNGSSWQLIGGPGSVITLGNLDAQSATAQGAALTLGVLSMQSATGSFPGLVNTSAQTLAGVKTFTSSINANAGIDRSTSGTLTIGSTNSTTINIGNSGATVNIQGTTIYENTPQLLVADPLITLNSGGGAGSGQNAGIAIEENAIVTGYMETSANRNSWILKAPNTAGVVTITPGASGFVIDQASHAPVTLAAVGSSANANAATLSGQALNLEPASASFPGVVTTGTQSMAGAKTFTTSAATPSLLLNGTVSGALTLVAAATTTPYTVTMPSAQGAAYSYLTNDGSGGLSWLSPTGMPVSVRNYTLVCSVGSNALTIAVKTLAGTDPSASDPVTVSFRSATATSGAYTTVTITSALSIVVPQGASLGRPTVSLNWPMHVWLINNSGTAEIAVCTSPGIPSIVTTTAITSGSTVVTTLYSTSARSSVPVTSIGILTINLTNNSNYDVVPTEVVLTAGLLDAASGRSASPLAFKGTSLGGYGTAGLSIGPASTCASTSGIAIGAAASVSNVSTNCISIGASSSTSTAGGTAAIAIGGSANAAASGAIAIGSDAQGRSTCNVSVGVGAGHTSTGSGGSISIGSGASTGAFANSIALSPGLTNTGTANCTAANQLSIGDSRTSTQITDVRIGRGAVAQTGAVDVTVGITPISGADAAGKNLTIQAGNGTGTGGSGQILFQTAPVAGSSSTANTMATRAGFAAAGGFFINGTTSGALTIKAAATTTDYTILWPAGQGAASSFLANDGSGNLSWNDHGTVVEATFAEAAWPITADQYGDLASISLTAGTWAISWHVEFVNTGVVSTTVIRNGVGTVTGNNATGFSLITNANDIVPPPTLSGSQYASNLASYIVTPGSTTTYYLKGRANGSNANLSAGGRITAIKLK